MTELVTWNIQAGLGVDGQTDLARIASVIKALADADVICLQEVCRHLPGSGDQVAELQQHFPGYGAFFGAAIDRLADGAASAPRMQFGNLVLSRLPVLQCFRHALPQPADATVQHMPRQATEVVVATPAGALRVVTTHLEFHSVTQRVAQTRRLLALEEEVRDAELHPARAPRDGPYAAVPRPARTLLCGDFNFETDSEEYRVLTGPGGLHDAWPALRGDSAHAPTCGIHDHVQWPAGAHCRDFFFCSETLLARVRAIEVDEQTTASDHQPVMLRLDETTH